MELLFFSFFFFSLFYYSYVHTRLGSFLPLAPTPSLTTHCTPSLSPHPLNTQQKLFCPKNMELLERLKRKDSVANVKLILKFAALQIMI
jgi:hypothetical protein